MSRSRTEVNANFHGPVTVGTSNSADYVIAHAARQQQRGRNPAVSYKGIKDPQAALLAAQSDIEARTSGSSRFIDYVAPNAGRVAVMKIYHPGQEVPATAYAMARIEDDLGVGAVISVLQPDEKPPQYQVIDNGTVELTYHYSPQSSM